MHRPDVRFGFAVYKMNVFIVIAVAKFSNLRIKFESVSLIERRVCSKTAYNAEI